jgi:WD repeat-containing protein 19
VVRVNLNHLDNLDKPREVLRHKCSTISIASLVANYCSKRGMYREAVEYLLLANKKEEAFVLAQSHDQMETYADHLKDCSNVERINIAQVFEGKGKWAKAAEQHELVQDPIKAQKLYEKAGEGAIDRMIELVVKYRENNTLQQMVMDYIMGDVDGKPKDAMYAYRLYRQLGNLKAAARIAVTIASEDQEAGRYKKAHTLLLETYQDIKKGGAAVPAELERKLLILHSYTLVVKIVIKLGEHEDAAFLLQRVCNNISQFPKNTVKILTTAFVEAQRANLKGLSYEYAVILMRSENKDEIKEDYRARIENVARKPVNAETREKRTPCPFCSEPVPEFRTDCPKCLNTIPFCLASGKHMLRDEITFCPRCNFTANYSYFKKVLALDKECPMCSSPVEPD